MGYKCGRHFYRKMHRAEDYDKECHECGLSAVARAMTLVEYRCYDKQFKVEVSSFGFIDVDFERYMILWGSMQ